MPSSNTGRPPCRAGAPTWRYVHGTLGTGRQPRARKVVIRVRFARAPLGLMVFVQCNRLILLDSTTVYENADGDEGAKLWDSEENQEWAVDIWGEINTSRSSCSTTNTITTTINKCRSINIPITISTFNNKRESLHINISYL